MNKTVRIGSLNLAGELDVFLFLVLYITRYSSLRLADHLSRGVLPNVMFRSV
jgi:hypothetical protein